MRLKNYFPAKASIVCFIFLTTAALLSSHASTGQTAPPKDSVRVHCRVKMPDPLNPPDWTVVINNPASLQNCTPRGQLQPYFEDVDLGTGTGFDHPLFGPQRRQCVCYALGYLEDLFQINNGVNATNPLIIKFAAPPTGMFTTGSPYAVAEPNFPVNSPGFHQSYMADGMLSGTPGLGNNFCGAIYVNFNTGIQFNYCGNLGDCDVDFLPVILHQMAHLIGVASALQKPTSAAVVNVLGPNTFTEWDNQFLYYDNAGTFIKMVTGTGSPAINSLLPAGYAANSKATWLSSASLATSRLNQPIFDDAGDDAYCHFREDFLEANYKSPGFLAPYIVSIRSVINDKGIRRYNFSLQELRMFAQLGLAVRPTHFTAPLIPNSPPRTLQKVVDPNPALFGIENHRLQTPPANNGFLYATTTTCQPLQIDLNGFSGAGSLESYDPISGSMSAHSMALDDPDGNAITVYVPPGGGPTSGQLWNINGCGPDAANPAPLTINATNDVITFTPRKNFTGRAAFAFHLSDGTERGSFIVVTIDVTKDCTCWANPTEMVVNGSLEAGTDYNRWDAASSSYKMPAMVDGTNFMENYVAYDGFFNQVHPDGVEPLEYSQLIFPAGIAQTYTPGYCYGPFQSYGSVPFPPAHASLIPPAPGIGGASNKRYGAAYYGQLSTGGTHPRSEANLTLSHKLLPGARYKVSFRYFFAKYPYPYTTAAIPAPAFSGHPLDLYFAPTLFTGGTPTAPPGAFISSSTAAIPSIPWSPSGLIWATYNAAFTYPASAPIGLSFMRLIYARASTPGADLFLYDDVSLQRDLTPTITGPGYCQPGASFSAVLTATVPGGGVTYQWYNASGNPIAGATGSTLTVTAYGTYTVKVTDDCGVSAQATINYTPCPSFSRDAGMPTVLGGTLSASPTAAPGATPHAYYICSDMHVTANATFSNDFVLIAPRVRITVDNGVLLTIDNSHLATCPDSNNMWRGIRLVNDWGHVRIINNSLIEDADTVVYIRDVTQNGTGGVSLTAVHPFLVETDGAVLNRNRVGISLYNDPNQTSFYRFVNTVFTCRTGIASDFTHWATPGVLKLPISNGLFPPFKLDRTPFIQADCRDGYPAHSGILLRNMGVTTAGPTFFPITAGEETGPAGMNLFDWMRAGIEAHNSSLSSRNNTFMRMRHVPGLVFNDPNAWASGNIGIFSESDPAHFTTQLSVETGGNVSGFGNRFYENFTGVLSYYNFNMRVDRALVTSANVSLAVNPYAGHDGVEALSDNFFQHSVDNSQIDNCTRGITIFNDMLVTRVANAFIRVAGNSLSVPLLTSPGWQNVSQGINVDNLVACIGCRPVGNAFVTVRNNTLSGVFNAISVTGFNYQSRNPVVESNRPIRLQDAVDSTPQYGVFIAHNQNPFVSDNGVSAGYTGNDAARAFYAAGDIRPIVTCNAANNIGRGFEFDGLNTAADWLRNDMTLNQRGFVLNSSIIGLQANAAAGAGVPCGNRWLGSWSGSNFSTFVFGGNAAASRLFIAGATTFTPSNNWATPAFARYMAADLPAASGASLPACRPTWRRGVSFFRLHEQIAQDSIIYGAGFEPRSKWIGQMQLYRAALADDTARDSSAVVASFFSTAAASRYAWLTTIEDSLSSGAYAAASGLMAAPPPGLNGVSGPNGVLIQDGPGGDSIVANYLAYFSLYLRWKTDTLNADDSASLAALAALCPRRDGAVVWQARALLRVISHQMAMYNDDCGNNVEEGADNARRGNVPVAQEYYLSPNPTDGSIQLTQRLADSEPVQIKVLNTLGAQVFRQTRRFAGKSLSLDLGILPAGIYHLSLQDSRGTIATIRFVKR